VSTGISAKIAEYSLSDRTQIRSNTAAATASFAAPASSTVPWHRRAPLGPDEHHRKKSRTVGHSLLVVQEARYSVSNIIAASNCRYFDLS
jgi:hypothetical protein